MGTIETDWEELFRSHFEQLKQSFEKDHPGTTYEKSHPAKAAYAEFHRSLPVPVRIMAIRLMPGPWHRVEDGLGYLVSFDLGRLGESGVKHLGERSCSLSESRDILKTEFGSRELEAFPPTPEFPIYQFMTWDPEKRWYTIFLPFDIAEKPKDLYTEMWFAFRSSIWTDLSNRLTFEINFNSEFNLKPDPVLPRGKLLRAARPRARRWDMHHPDEGPVVLTLENLQRDVQSFQLIPSVPEGVRKIFRTAKKLYVFGYFDESFYHVAEHYATLALESALKARYWQDVKFPLVLSNLSGESLALVRGSYGHVYRLCIGDPRWNLRTVKINGSPFLFTNRQLLHFMGREGILTHWERDMCTLLINVRNTLSHPSSISVIPSKKDWLEMAAKFINTLYIEPSRKKKLLEEHRRKQRLK